MKRLGLLVAASACLLAGSAAAQEWPARPVRIVNTFAPGGAADILARIVADHLSSAFKQQFFVETRAGAGGVIGVQTVANSILTATTSSSARCRSPSSPRSSIPRSATTRSRT